tara:strand:- start:389 stop:511 length:123 start_codon:yes stop_codon:yes gene_type:complete
MVFCNVVEFIKRMPPVKIVITHETPKKFDRCLPAEKRNCC